MVGSEEEKLIHRDEWHFVRIHIVRFNNKSYKLFSVETEKR